MNAYLIALFMLGLPEPIYNESQLQCNVMLFSHPERNLVFEVAVDQDRNVIVKTPVRAVENRNPKLEKEILKLATVSVREIFEQNRVILLDMNRSSLPLMDHRLFVRISNENYVGSAVSTRRAHDSVQALLRQLKIAFPDIPEIKILQPGDSVNGGKSRD